MAWILVARRFLAAVALSLSLAGCAAAPPVPQTEPLIEPVPLESLYPGIPRSILLPSIGASSDLVPLGVTADGKHEVPPVTQPEQAGWYEPGPEPGEVGPAIVLGHVNGGGKPGVFSRLHEVKPGDEVVVDDKTFKVTEVQRAPKTNFPADKVYAPTDKVELRVITCGGGFDGENYLDNIIVFATLA